MEIQIIDLRYFWTTVQISYENVYLHFQVFERKIENFSNFETIKLEYIEILQSYYSAGIRLNFFI